MADRLSRHSEGTAELFLADTLPGGERAIGNRLDQLLVGPVDQCRLGVKGLHPLSVAEFRILGYATTEQSKGLPRCSRPIGAFTAVTFGSHPKGRKRTCCRPSMGSDAGPLSERTIRYRPFMAHRTG